MKDYFGYKDKICIVTGAGSGVGKAVASILADMGAKVYTLARKPVPVSGVTEIHCDLRYKEDIDRAFSKIPEKIDCYFGCAGVFGTFGSFMEVLTVDFISNKYITEKYLAHRMDSGSAIGYISSNNGHLWSNAEMIPEFIDTVQANGWDGTVKQLTDAGLDQNSGMTGYNYAKRCMTYYSKKAAFELSAKGIRVNCVVPGPINTPMLHRAMKELGFSKKDCVEGVLVNIDRIAEAEEVALPLIFLGSDMAAFVTACDICTDYGLHSYVQIGFKEDVEGGQPEHIIRTDK